MGTLLCFSKAVISLLCFPFLHRVFPAVGGPLLFLYSLTPLPLLLSLVFLLLSLVFRYVFYGCVCLCLVLLLLSLLFRYVFYGCVSTP